MAEGITAMAEGITAMAEGITAMAEGIDGNCRRCRRVISGLYM